MICKFYTSGRCNKGSSCAYIHDISADAQYHASWTSANVSTFGQLSLEPSKVAESARTRNQNIPCHYFLNGNCKRGNECMYLHTAFDVPQKNSALNFSTNEDVSLPFQTSSDSRLQIPCRFQLHTGGCNRPACPYKHDHNSYVAGNDDGGDGEKDEDEIQNSQDNFVRELAGARVHFGEQGNITKIFLPSDFSSACITGLQPDATPDTVVENLRPFGFNIPAECVRITGRESEQKAVVKLEGPLFAKELSDKLLNRQSTLRATPVHDGVKHTSYRKLHVSWHRPTRSVWMNFGSDTIANRVAQKFKDGKYTIMRQQVKSATVTKSSSRGSAHSNPVPWTVTLVNVPASAQKQDIDSTIFLHDKPRHIEMSPVSYAAAEVKVKEIVRKRLEQYGPLESLVFNASSTGKRAKAAAWFFSEADARSACSLNDESLEILGKGRLTVSLVQSVNIKVSVVIFSAVTPRLGGLVETWRKNHLTFRQFEHPSRKFMTLKIGGLDPKLVAGAHKALNNVLAGHLIVNAGGALWDPTFERNGHAYQKVKSLATESGALIIRDKLKRQLRYYGPESKLEQLTQGIVKIVAEGNLESFKIKLTPAQFGWAVRGGFKDIEHAVGRHVAILDVGSKTISIDGTYKQVQTAASIVEGKEITSALIGGADQEGDCPICLCEAENGIQTVCGYTYCLECLEDSGRSAAGNGGDRIEVECQGNAGECHKTFTFCELNDYLSTSIFEYMLKAFFEQYVQRHPNDFRYCPTPDCGYIYRCTKEDAPQALLTHVCSNCLEAVCRSCHARHGSYTCAEYKDIASGGYAALAKLKAELNIKDCPKCTTPMEKTEGCNHMTCPGCKSHICWVCLEIFASSGPCYAHMKEAHGGIGFDHLAALYG